MNSLRLFPLGLIFFHNLCKLRVKLILISHTHLILHLYIQETKLHSDTFSVFSKVLCNWGVFYLHAALHVPCGRWRVTLHEGHFNSFVFLSAGSGAAPNGTGKRRTAHHIVRPAHYGASHVRESRSDHNAGSCVWSSRSAAGKRQVSMKICD